MQIEIIGEIHNPAKQATLAQDFFTEKAGVKFVVVKVGEIWKALFFDNLPEHKDIVEKILSHNVSRENFLGAGFVTDGTVQQPKTGWDSYSCKESFGWDAPEKDAVSVLERIHTLAVKTLNIK